MVPGADAPHILGKVSSSSVSPPSIRTTGEDGRAFLQERLTFLGKVFCFITLGFYVAGNLAAVLLPDTVAPNRGYLVTAFANDGVGELYPIDYKIGGAHFAVPDPDGQVVVELQPNPLPLA